jgi:predicted DNA-binding transcriptional regulator AlpA
MNADLHHEVTMIKLSSSATIFGAVELPPEIARHRVLDEKTAAEFIGLSQVTLERMRKLGTAPKHLVLSTRRLGYRVCDLLAWLDARAASSGEAA